MFYYTVEISLRSTGGHGDNPNWCDTTNRILYLRGYYYLLCFSCKWPRFKQIISLFNFGKSKIFTLLQNTYCHHHWTVECNYIFKKNWILLNRKRWSRSVQSLLLLCLSLPASVDQVSISFIQKFPLNTYYLQVQHFLCANRSILQWSIWTSCKWWIRVWCVSLSIVFWTEMPSV